jgi:outer membrane receptor protein involved in Fe transport
LRFGCGQRLHGVARYLLPAALLCALLYSSSLSTARAQSQAMIRGTIEDPAGQPVANARVKFKGPNVSAATVSDTQGHFIFSGLRADRGMLVVEASGFEPVTQHWTSQGQTVSVVAITLTLRRLSQQVTVTAERTPTLLSQTAENVVVLSQNDLESTSALTIDGALDQVPGFTLYLRLGSEVANPTDQGVSLRGVGSNGASRALVLADGIPLNDPFGGWIYWDRVATAAVQRMEVAEGGASSLYGSDAMGGVINIITRRANHSEFTLDTSYGNETTPDASLWANTEWRNWGAQLQAEGFSTNGYILVPNDIRGPVDTPAASSHTLATITLDRQLSRRSRAFLTGSVFGEARKNGTPLQTNNTHLRELDAGWDWQSNRWGEFALRGYGEAQLYDQTFSAIATSRQTETLTSLQRIPAQEAGYSVHWMRPRGARQTWVAGVEGAQVRGAADGLNYTSGEASSAVGPGGRQNINGIYAEDLIRPASRWIVTLSGRFDGWRNFDALSTTRPLLPPSPAAVTYFAPRSESAFSPHASVLRQLTSGASVYASFYQAFRAPTLNELYRPYRVGDVLTLANSGLVAERLTGEEVGGSYAPLHDRLRMHATLFWNNITQPIENVTLTTTPSLITEERENLGSTTSRGAELEADAELRPSLMLSGGYQFTDARVVSFPGDVALQGLFVPEVPRSVFTVQTRYTRSSLFTLALQGRYMGRQFSDDLNQYPLNPAFEMDALASHSFKQRAEIYGAVQNLSGERYEVARVPYAQVGPPVLFRIGFRFNWGMR